MPDVRDGRVPGVRIVALRPFDDERGSFKEAYARSKYHAFGVSDDFVQDNVSVSKSGVLRGLHADPQMSKLVYVLQGMAFDVIVDARKGSPSFGKWEAFHLNAAEPAQIYIPAGCLHGFLALCDDTIFCYKQSAEYAPEREIGVKWDDPDLAIEWPLAGTPKISAKDLRNGSFRDAIGSGLQV